MGGARGGRSRDYGSGRLRGAQQEERPWAASEITPENWGYRFAAIQAAITTLAETVLTVAPDVVVTVGDDLREVFSADHMPAINIYWGESLYDVPPDSSALSEVARSMIWSEHDEVPMMNPTEPELGRHIIESLVTEGFDVSNTQRLPEGQNIGHAFNFVYQRIMSRNRVPQVPIMLNTAYPPSQPSIKRCYRLCQALRRAIEAWDSDKRIALVASGGLSRFVVDEKLDRAILDALLRDDFDALTRLPEEPFRCGSSEDRNWVTVAGAMTGSGLGMEIVAYVPLIRTSAGTGVGAGFAQWR